MRNTLADQVDSSINSGSTDAQGDFVILDGATDLIEFNLQDPAFGNASSGQITLAGTPLSTTADAGGTADTFEVRDKDNNMVYTGSVTATGGGGDIEIDNTNVNSGQSAELSSHSYTAPS
jgi:hypothetical protein